MKNPYKLQPNRAFWRRSVADRHAFEISDLYSKRFEITPEMKIVSMGSCFAQHLGKRLKASGFKYLDFERAPQNLPASLRKKYGYGVYSARYGNIYTSRQLVQLYKRSFGTFSPEDDIWEVYGRFYDAFRPTVEPDGFRSREELLKMRDYHLRAVRNLFTSGDLFIFTFGLTECWLSRADGAAYPMCPGTAAGTFDPEKYAFHNFTVSEIVEDMRWIIGAIRAHNPDAKFLFTVSPVPLMATATDDHVLTATTYSKSVLRAVCGELTAIEGVGYFPSYEIITAPVLRGAFYEPDQREVNRHGVEHVMKQFFRAHPYEASSATPVPLKPAVQADADDDFVVCDEMMLDKQAERVA